MSEFINAISLGMNMNWIKTEDELPPCDGIYYCCHNDYEYPILHSFYYDGRFFYDIEENFHVINIPKFWYIHDTLKRYGKINKEKK